MHYIENFSSQEILEASREWARLADEWEAAIPHAYYDKQRKECIEQTAMCRREAALYASLSAKKQMTE